MGRGIRTITIVAVSVLATAASAACTSASSSPSAAASATAASAQASVATTSDGSASAKTVARIAAEAMSTYHLRSVEVVVTRDGLDYVYADQVLAMGNTDSLHRWTNDQLIAIGAQPPLQFAPGTNWGYSHTNYTIVGKLLPKVTGMTLDASLEKYVLKPMGLDHTQGALTAALPIPVMHTYSSERREALGIPAATPFYEESTFWDPTRTVPIGTIQSTTIADLTASMDAVARGIILSKASHHAQTDDLSSGFGHKDPACAVCNQNTDAHNYGLGVVNEGKWVTQTMNFSGHGATADGLANKKLSIAVSTKSAPAAFDASGAYSNASNHVFESLADALAPGTGPTPKSR